MEKIQPLWRDYLADVAAHRAKVLTLPGSKILDDRLAFENFTTASGISVVQPGRHD